MTKKYFLEQIEKVENLIGVKTRFHYSDKINNTRTKLFGNAYQNYKRFKKESLYEYLEILVSEGLRLEILDNTFAY